MPLERVEAALATRPRTRQPTASETVSLVPDELLTLPRAPADPDLYNRSIDAALDPAVDPAFCQELTIQYFRAELARLVGEKPREQAQKLPGLTAREAAAALGLTRPNGRPQDSFYTTVAPLLRRWRVGSGDRYCPDSIEEFKSRGGVRR